MSIGLRRSRRQEGQTEQLRRPFGRSLRRVAFSRSFDSTMAALDALTESGAKVSVCVQDLDRKALVLSGDDLIPLPIAGLGTVALLIEVASQIQQRTLDPAELIDRRRMPAVAGSGLWQHLMAPSLTVADLAVLSASSGDALASNALLQRVGLAAVRARLESLGVTRSALMDSFRDQRGPDDAPQVAVGVTREFAGLFAALVDSNVVSRTVSAQVSDWLAQGQDLSLVASVTGLDPFDHAGEEHGLVFLNKTGRGPGLRAEAGVLAGPRGGVSYALTVCFDDLSIMARLRAHDAFRTLGLDLMEYVF